MGKVFKRNTSVYYQGNRENHKIKSGKNSNTIIKTTDRGKRFKEERYLSADDVFAANTERIFYVKGKCKASMKREIRSMEVGINKVNCDIIFAKCICLAGWRVRLL